MRRAILLLLILAAPGVSCDRGDRTTSAPRVIAVVADDASVATVAITVADASTPSSPMDASPPDRRVPIARHEVRDGAFTAAFLETVPPIAVRVRVLPFATLPHDQRVDSGTIEPATDDLRRAEPPFTQLGTYRDAKNTRLLALVEARPQQTLEEAEDAPFVWWFAARSAPRPLAPAVGSASGWRVWKGAAGHRQMNPDVLAIENAAGDPIAIRYLGAVSSVSPLSIDAAVPMFLASVLESASGVDDPVTLLVIGLLDAELRVLRSVSAGPRSAVDKGAIGPLGSIAPATKDGKHALRIRAVEQDENAPCYPGTIAESGCNGTERVDVWDPASRRFVDGTASKVVLRQKAPSAPVTAAPR